MRKLYTAIISISLITLIVSIVLAAYFYDNVSPSYKYNPDQAFGTVEISIDGGVTWTAQDLTAERSAAPSMYARWISTSVGHAGSVTFAWWLEDSTDGISWVTEGSKPQLDNPIVLTGLAGQTITANDTALIFHDFTPVGGFQPNLYYRIHLHI